MIFFAAGTSVLGVEYFWVAFIVASILGQVNVPFLSKFVRDTAKRGKTRGVNFEEDDDRSKTKRILLNVPHAWFTHFYVVGTTWNAYTLLQCIQSKRNSIGVFSFAKAVLGDSSGELLASVLFQFHVTRRLMESLFVKVNKKKAQMHAIGYVLGLLYYVCATLSLKSSNEEKGERKADFFFASLLFFYANWKQYECHVLLRNARLQTDRRDQYAQIDSGLFSLVACPHYFFECVLYFSLCVILRFSKSSALMFLAVCGNLSVEAKNHLIWYRHRIKGFPRHRKAMVPYLY